MLPQTIERNFEDQMGKTVLITGAGSGFGKGTAIALAARGHRVIATTETQSQAEALSSEVPQLKVVKLDITSDFDVTKAKDFDIDVLINNAGAGQTGPLADVHLDRVRHLFEVNVFGTLAITQALLPKMAARGNGNSALDRRVPGLKPPPHKRQATQIEDNAVVQVLNRTRGKAHKTEAVLRVPPSWARRLV